MKNIPANVEMTQVSEVHSDKHGSISVLVNKPLYNKYDWRFFKINSPVIVFAIVDNDDELDVEVRPITYDVAEEFHYPLDAKYVLVGYDQGLLGGKSKPFTMGYNKVEYDYINAVFLATSDFVVYSTAKTPTEERFIITINKDQNGRRELLIGDNWAIGDENTIGGYINI